MSAPRLYPSPFVKGDRFTFENKHGRCVLEAVEDPRPVRSILLAQCPLEDRMTWDELEQIALITDQVRLQPLLGGFSRADGKCAFVRHATTSTAAFVKVVELSYVNKTPAHEQIARDLAGGRNSHLLP